MKREDVGWCHIFAIFYLHLDETEFRNLIYWLENMKIRFYPPENRNELLSDAPNWDEGLSKVFH